MVLSKANRNCAEKMATTSKVHENPFIYRGELISLGSAAFSVSELVTLVFNEAFLKFSILSRCGESLSCSSTLFDAAECSNAAIVGMNVNEGNTATPKIALIK